GGVVRPRLGGDGMAFFRSRLRASAFAFAALIAFLIAAPGWTQNQGQNQGATGQIAGRTVDSQQLALPKTTLEVLDAQGNVVRRTVGQDDGRYQLAVPPGTYTLQFSKSGFQTVKVGPVTVAAGQTVARDAVLPPAGLEQGVTVYAPQDYSTASKTDVPD